jgi:sporulenol synthase
MILKDRVEAMITSLTRRLIGMQEKDGCWRFCFESGVMTDAYMILLLLALGKNNDPLIPRLAGRIQAMQTAVGTWKQFPDEKEGNVTATLEACLALFYAGFRDPAEPVMKKARRFIREYGGARRVGSLAKVVLNLLGHESWRFPKLPVELFLFPPSAPLSFFKLPGYTRVHVAPIMLAAERNFSVQLKRFRVMEDWLPRNPVMMGTAGEFDWQSAEWLWIQGHARLHGWHEEAVRRGKQFLLERIEPDGTLYSYMTTTFLMVFALMALGDPIDRLRVKRAVEGLKTLAFPGKYGLHIQEATSTVWDTALVLYALQEAGLSSDHPAVKRGLQYLLSRQHTRFGDWSVSNPGVEPGGWGFSDVNTLNPDVDDTSACLRALAPSVRDGKHRSAWKKGVTWLLSMQNRDGGWPAFEKNLDNQWLKLLPHLVYRDVRTVWSDPSTADLTGRMLEFCGRHLGWTTEWFEVRMAWDSLIRQQRSDGSWFGRWGVCHIYGTWAALTGLAAVRVPRDDPAVDKGLRWLLSIQNKDGGWGESCASDIHKRYVPLHFSTPVQTAWALDALIAWHDKPTPEIRAGISRLLHLLERPGPERDYPTGAGLAGQFYVNYHSYPWVWPLLALVHYRNKYREKKDN